MFFYFLKILFEEELSISVFAFVELHSMLDFPGLVFAFLWLFVDSFCQYCRQEKDKDQDFGHSNNFLIRYKGKIRIALKQMAKKSLFHQE